jgi:tripartite-type tricarboxylate transporter receptor subunit TctC
MTCKRWLAAAMPLALFTFDANAQSWPSRPIDVIIPFPAGGSVDVIGRAVATAIGEELGQQVVIGNRDGASGTIGFNALASAPPDGYTLGAGPTTPIANAPYLMKGVRYGVDSFEYICHVFENSSPRASCWPPLPRTPASSATAIRAMGPSRTLPSRIWRMR